MNGIFVINRGIKLLVGICTENLRSLYLNPYYQKRIPILRAVQRSVENVQNGRLVPKYLPFNFSEAFR